MASDFFHRTDFIFTFQLVSKCKEIFSPEGDEAMAAIVLENVVVFVQASLSVGVAMGLLLMLQARSRAHHLLAELHCMYAGVY